MQVNTILNRITHIEAAVKKAEHKFNCQERVRELPAGWRAFSTSAPRSAAYQATPSHLLLAKLDEMKLPREFHIADLGSGLGMACFISSLYFNHATGFEMDPAVYQEAENIRQELQINNVSFKNQDFLNADFSPFKVLYIFQPFLDGFIQLFSEKILEAKPGTIILANIFEPARRDVFHPAAFKPIKSDPQTSFFPLALDYIHAYQRF